MATRISQAAAMAAVEAIRAGLNGGTIRIQSAAQAATASDALPGTTLATITGVAVVAVAISGNYAQFTLTGTVSDLTADATGTAASFRWSDSADAGGASTGAAGEIRVDGAVGLTGSGAELELSSLNIVAGNPVHVTSMVVRIPMH